MGGTSTVGGSTFADIRDFTTKTLDTPITGILPDQLVTLSVTITVE